LDHCSPFSDMLILFQKYLYKQKAFFLIEPITYKN